MAASLMFHATDGRQSGFIVWLSACLLFDYLSLTEGFSVSPTCMVGISTPLKEGGVSQKNLVMLFISKVLDSLIPRNEASYSTPIHSIKHTPLFRVAVVSMEGWV